MAVKRSRSIKQKRARRTQAEIAQLKEAIVSVLEEIKPATARQVFYQLASYLQVIPNRGAIQKHRDPVAFKDAPRQNDPVRMVER